MTSVRLLFKARGLGKGRAKLKEGRTVAKCQRERRMVQSYEEVGGRLCC